MNVSSTDRAVLAWSGLAVGYSGRPVLTGLEQTVHPGQFAALLGPNGAGKTTLLRTLAGLLPPLAGRVLLGGRVLANLSPAETARTLAVVLTERHAPAMLSALELVCLGRTPHTGFLGRIGPQDRERAVWALELVGAGDLARRPMDQLSDGERQKVMLARALAQDPRVILLDEPTLHLDVKHRLEVVTILRRLCRQQGIAVVASLHDVDLALRLADVVGLVGRGGISAWGAPEKELTAASLAALYGLEQARFSPHLGVMELAAEPGMEQVFVVCGGGSGAGLLRALAKQGFALKTGVLHEHDLDCLVAQSLGAQVVSQAPFLPLAEEGLRAAAQAMSGCLAVVDSGFPLGDDNRANLDLLRQASAMVLPIYSLRAPEELARHLDGNADAARCCQGPAQLVEALSRLRTPPAAAP
ncbi:MAG: ABC transporter ATP-binding protein [Thermodesulfobacteriota bacterium]